MLDIRKVLTAKPKPHGDAQLAELVTPWGETLDRARPLPEHPAPQARRAGWASLNGVWRCAFAAGAPSAVGLPDALVNAKPPKEIATPIVVPFSPEAPLSGVGRQLMPSELLWYEREFASPDVPEGWRTVLRFEAVDHACAVWLNGELLGTHVGGYLPFAFDATDALRGEDNRLVVCVADPSEQGGQLRGKQRLDRGDIWYTAQSGIWQSVWLEWMPERHITRFTLDARYRARCLRVEAEASELAVRIIDADGREVARAAAQAMGEGDKPEVERGARGGFSRGRLAEGGLALETAKRGYAVGGGVSADAPEGKAGSDNAPAGKAGADDAPPACRLACEVSVPDAHPWSPRDPYLYAVELTCGDDVVESYCGFRDVEVRNDDAGTSRVFLNGEPIFLKGVLDQGYWPDGLMTAPSDEALVSDIDAARAAGFNMVRKHIKVESARWYYHCDRLGLLVWQDMVSGGGVWDTWHVSYKPTLFKASWGRYDDRPAAHQRHLLAGDARYRRAWTDAMRGTIGLLRNHPSIVAWVLFNEGWGQFDARAALEAAREVDSTRPVDAVSGWYDQHCGDFCSVHNYFRPLEVWPDRDGRAFVVSEFGGLTLAVPGHTSLPEAYGYATYDSADAWRRDVRAMLAHMGMLEAAGLAGFVYTQLTDVEEEVNGIFTYDRRVNKLHGARGRAAATQGENDQ